MSSLLIHVSGHGDLSCLNFFLFMRFIHYGVCYFSLYIICDPVCVGTEDAMCFMLYSVRYFFTIYYMWTCMCWLTCHTVCFLKIGVTLCIDYGICMFELGTELLWPGVWITCLLFRCLFFMQLLLASPTSILPYIVETVCHEMQNKRLVGVYYCFITFWLHNVHVTLKSRWVSQYETRR